MRASPTVRLLTIPLVIAPVILGLSSYMATRDWRHLWRQVELGHALTWPPRAQPGPRPIAVEISERALASVVPLAEVAAVTALLFAGIVLASRGVHRRRRQRATQRWELRLGRDDLANPYRVQEMFEGIAGAIGVRWYERLWRGPEHVALEIARLPDASIRFLVAAPRYLAPSIRGPLEDLYPDVALLDVGAEPARAGCLVRLKKRAPFVLSIQTTRNYEHAFTESLVALMDKSSGEITVQLVLTPAAGFVHRRARRLLKRRERTLQHADHRDAGELGISSVIEAKELKGALELQHRSLYLVDLRVAGEDDASVRRIAGLFAQLRSENELAPRQTYLRRALYDARVAHATPNPLPGLRVGVLSTQSSRRSGNSLAGALSTAHCCARVCGGRARQQGSSATPRES